jgi:hypothetical protein
MKRAAAPSKQGDAKKRIKDIRGRAREIDQREEKTRGRIAREKKRLSKLDRKRKALCKEARIEWRAHVAPEQARFIHNAHIEPRASIHTFTASASEDRYTTEVFRMDELVILILLDLAPREMAQLSAVSRALHGKVSDALPFAVPRYEAILKTYWDPSYVIKWRRPPPFDNPLRDLHETYKRYTGTTMMIGKSLAQAPELACEWHVTYRVGGHIRPMVAERFLFTTRNDNFYADLCARREFERHLGLKRNDCTPDELTYDALCTLKLQTAVCTTFCSIEERELFQLTSEGTFGAIDNDTKIYHFNLSTLYRLYGSNIRRIPRPIDLYYARRAIELLENIVTEDAVNRSLVDFMRTM